MNQGTPGTFFGVGVGPGDPELITRKAERILRTVDWIFLPSGTHGGIGFAHRIIEPLGIAAAKFRPVVLCMSRDRGADQATYRGVAHEIVAELRRGLSVAWITEGDPLFYSTFLHLYKEMCRFPDVRVEIVPGVTSASAAAARAGIPVARLQEKVAIVPAAYGLQHLPILLDTFATVFLLKVNNVFDALLTTLATLPPSVRAIYVEQVGTPGEQVIENLESLRGRGSLLLLASHLEEAVRRGDAVNHRGKLFVVGLGPGAREVLTGQAQEVLRQAEVVVGYEGYFRNVSDLVEGKECLALPLTQEMERARLAVERLCAGQTVCVISSGDPGIYAMASLVLEYAAGVDESLLDVIQVIPGVSAVNAAAALLGAPLGHDFAVVSLSDLLTPWEVIARRLQAVATADFVLALLNPRSQRRDWQFHQAQEILAQQRPSLTPVGIVRNAFRPGQMVEITTLGQMAASAVDMFTTVIVGNSRTRRFGNVVVTPRGYSLPNRQGNQHVESE